MPIEDEQARLLTCIGDPTRLKILKLLTQSERYVGEIVESLKVEQSLVSYHLRHLRECNIVIDRQDAQKTYYRLSDKRLAELVITSEAVIKDIFLCSPGGASDKKADRKSRYLGIPDKV